MTLSYPVSSLTAHPARLSPAYKSTVKRSPSKPLIPMRHTLTELTGPVYGHETVREHDHDLTIQHKGEPLGERIIVHGHVLDEDGRGVPNVLVELWQANACGRYFHVVDQHPAPLDPNFTGAGRAQSDAQGYYKFVTVKPGAYPWGNHHNAWRPAHIHFSVFGHAFISRLVTQMYFPGDPLFEFDPIFNSVPDEKARMRMVSAFDLDNTPPEWGALLPLQHCAARMQCHADGDEIVQGKVQGKVQEGLTPSQTVGPFFKYGLTPGGQYDWNDAFINNLVTPDTSGERIRVQGRVFDGDGQPVPDCMLEIWQADAQGRFSDPQDKRALPNSSFKGFGRCGTDANGGFAFDTIKPGTVLDADGKLQAPHILLAIFARGMLLHNYSRIYFDGEAGNAADPILALVPTDRRATLIAARKPGGGNAVYQLDIRLQGDDETVFFDI